MKGGHRRVHTSRKFGMDLAAGWPRESHTAAVKRAQSHSVSSSFSDWDEGELEESEGGMRESIESVSARVYGGK